MLVQAKCGVGMLFLIVCTIKYELQGQAIMPAWCWSSWQDSNENNNCWNMIHNETLKRDIVVLGQHGVSSGGRKLT